MSCSVLRCARTASAPFVASEQHSFCAKTAASKQRLRQFHSANDDVRRPSGPRRPYAHPSSTTTDRARKRASPNYFFPPAHPFDCCSSSGAAVQRFSQQRHLGGIGAPAAAEQPLAYTGAFLSRAHAGAARAGAELSRGAGTLLPAVRSGHWCLSSPPRQPGALAILLHHRRSIAERVVNVIIRLRPGQQSSESRGDNALL